MKLDLKSEKREGGNEKEDKRSDDQDKEVRTSVGNLQIDEMSKTK